MTLLRSLVACRLLRHKSFHAVESLVCSPARQAIGVRRTFGDDVLGYFTKRLDVH